MVKIIGISGIGGAGKSVLTDALGKKLSATTIYWDNFDEISEDPKDYIEWYKTSKNYEEWKYDSLAFVLNKLKQGTKLICPATKKELIPTDYIVADLPLGRKHKATGRYIDFNIYVDTPLDVALARRLLRDFQDKKSNPNLEILDELEFYLTSSRPLYEMDYESKNECDLVIDGTLSVEINIEKIINKIKFWSQNLYA